MYLILTIGIFSCRLCYENQDDDGYRQFGREADGDDADLMMECCTTSAQLLDNSAAKHKLSVRPPQQRKRRSTAVRGDGSAVEEDDDRFSSSSLLMAEDQVDEVALNKKMKTATDASSIATASSNYRRSRSGRIVQHSSVDPRSKRESVFCYCVNFLLNCPNL